MSSARVCSAFLAILLLLVLVGERGEAGVPNRDRAHSPPAHVGRPLSLVTALRGGGRRRRKDWQSPRRGDSDYQSESSDPEWDGGAAEVYGQADSDEESVDSSASGRRDRESDSDASYAWSSHAQARRGQHAGARRRPQRARRAPARSPSPPPPRTRGGRGRGRAPRRATNTAARWGTRADDALAAALRGELVVEDEGSPRGSFLEPGTPEAAPRARAPGAGTGWRGARAEVDESLSSAFSAHGGALGAMGWGDAGEGSAGWAGAAGSSGEDWGGARGAPAWASSLAARGTGTGGTTASGSGSRELLAAGAGASGGLASGDIGAVARASTERRAGGAPGAARWAAGVPAAGAAASPGAAGGVSPRGVRLYPQRTLGPPLPPAVPWQQLGFGAAPAAAPGGAAPCARPAPGAGWGTSLASAPAGAAADGADGAKVLRRVAEAVARRESVVVLGGEDGGDGGGARAWVQVGRSETGGPAGVHVQKTGLDARTVEAALLGAVRGADAALADAAAVVTRAGGGVEGEEAEAREGSPLPARLRAAEARLAEARTRARALLPLLHPRGAREAQQRAWGEHAGAPAARGAGEAAALADVVGKVRSWRRRAAVEGEWRALLAARGAAAAAGDAEAGGGGPWVYVGGGGRALGELDALDALGARAGAGVRRVVPGGGGAWAWVEFDSAAEAQRAVAGAAQAQAAGGGAAVVYAAGASGRVVRGGVAVAVGA